MDIFDAPIPSETDAFGSKDSEPGGVGHCRDCGALLPPKTGPGRKPTRCENCRATKPTGGRKAPTSGSTRVVTEALGTMDGIYTMAEVGFLMVSADAAAAFTARRDEAMARNKAAFESNRKLAEKVAKLGQGSGSMAFVLAQVYLVAPAAIAAGAEVRVRRAERLANTETGYEPGTVTTEDGTTVPENLAHLL